MKRHELFVIRENLTSHIQMNYSRKTSFRVVSLVGGLHGVSSATSQIRLAVDLWP
jgi:hypothetical protein